MKLIVGLGNPGKQYDGTRHNVGFMAIDILLKHYGINAMREKYNGLYGEVLINDEKIILLKPQKFMNLSGEVVKSFVDFYHLPINDLLIIHDDLDMPIGKLKWRPKGSSGGHNGLKNIETNLHTDVYNRLKIGISNNKQIDTKDYVLGHFDGEDKKNLSSILKEMPQYIEDYLTSSFDCVMNKYNKK